MTEQQPYAVIRSYGDFELRRYDAHVVAEVTVPGPRDSAGNRAFRSLVGYIGGKNDAGRSMAMTAPVVGAPATGRKLAMTAPVVQQPADTGFTVAFVLPAGETLETLPTPTDEAVTVRAVLAETAAALRYSGRWSESGYADAELRLRASVVAAGLTASGPARWARFDPPWTPWFLRRNEIVLPVRD